MTLKELYKKAISTGIENDPRGKDAVLKELDARKKILRNSRKTKEFFDSETLENPYSDSRILNGTGEEKIKSALVGIDIEVGELLLAENLKAKREERRSANLSSSRGQGLRKSLFCYADAVRHITQVRSAHKYS